MFPSLLDIAKLFVALPILGVIAWAGHRYVVLRLFVKFDKIQEYVFLLTIGWCLGIAQLAESMGLSYEIGAFAAGVAIGTWRNVCATCPSVAQIRTFETEQTSKLLSWMVA